MIISNGGIANGKRLFSVLRTSLKIKKLFHILKVEKRKNVEQNTKVTWDTLYTYYERDEGIESEEELC